MKRLFGISVLLLALFASSSQEAGAGPLRQSPYCGPCYTPCYPVPSCYYPQFYCQPCFPSYSCYNPIPCGFSAPIYQPGVIPHSGPITIPGGAIGEDLPKMPPPPPPPTGGKTGEDLPKMPPPPPPPTGGK